MPCTLPCYMNLSDESDNFGLLKCCCLKQPGDFGPVKIPIIFRSTDIKNDNCSDK